MEYIDPKITRKLCLPHIISWYKVEGWVFYYTCNPSIKWSEHRYCTELEDIIWENLETDPHVITLSLIKQIPSLGANQERTRFSLWKWNIICRNINSITIATTLYMVMKAVQLFKWRIWFAFANLKFFPLPIKLKSWS